MITRIPDPWVMRNYAFLSPDGRHALIRLEDPNGDTGVAASIVDTETGEIHTVLDTPGQERVFGWSTDGSHIFVANSVTGTPVLWAVPVADGQRSGDPILVRRNLHGLTVGKVIADRFYYWTLASDTRMLTVEIDVADGTVLREPSTEMAGLPERMEWSPDGKYAASYRSHVVTVQSFDGLHKQQFEITREYRGEVSMMRWEPNSRSLTFRIRPDQVTLDLDTGTFSNDGTVSVYSSALMPDGETGYGVDSRGIFRTNRHSTERSFIVEAGSTDHPECFEGVLSRRISDTRRYVSVSSVTSLQEGPFCVGVLDTRTESFRWLFSVHSRPMPWAEAMVTPDDRRIMFKLATSSDDAEVWMISLEDVSPVPWKIFSYPGLRNATLHPNGRTLAFVGGKEYTEFWVMEGLDDVIAY